MVPALALMNRSFASRMRGTGAARAGADRRRLLGGARVDRRRARRQDARPRTGRGRAPARARRAAARRTRPGGARSAPGSSRPRGAALDRDDRAARGRRLARVDRPRHARAPSCRSSPCSACSRGRCGSSAGSCPSCRAPSSATSASSEVLDEPSTVPHPAAGRARCRPDPWGPCGDRVVRVRRRRASSTTSPSRSRPNESVAIVGPTGVGQVDARAAPRSGSTTRAAGRSCWAA